MQVNRVHQVARVGQLADHLLLARSGRPSHTASLPVSTARRASPPRASAAPPHSVPAGVLPSAGPLAQAGSPAQHDRLAEPELQARLAPRLVSAIRRAARAQVRATERLNWSALQRPRNNALHYLI